MSFRTRLVILGTVFVALLAALILGSAISPRGSAQRAAARQLFPGLDPDRVQVVEISDASQSVRLVRGKGWTIDVDGRGFPASSDRVEGFLKQIVSLIRGTVVTRDTKAADGLGLSAKDARRIVLSGSGGITLRGLTVGKPAAGGGHYLLVEDAAEVLQTGEGLSPYLSADRLSWAELRILPRDVKPDAVMRVSVSSSMVLPDTKPGARIEYTLLREKDSSGALAWAFSPGEMRLQSRAGAKVDQEKAGQLASAIVMLEAADVLVDPALAASAIASPSATVTVSLTDNRTFTIMLGAPTAARQYPCGLNEGSLSYLVPEWRVQAILLPMESLLVR